MRKEKMVTPKDLAQLASIEVTAAYKLTKYLNSSFSIPAVNDRYITCNEYLEIREYLTDLGRLARRNYEFSAPNFNGRD